ncbi:MAG: YihY/virulence factor BrkB family protein [Acidobacteria bacterium]|nr:YihY/virulence factor BrkB family protein [Acidobacteriota bacterium]
MVTRIRLAKAKRFLFALASEWARVETQRRSACLAFFSMLSIAPLLVVAVWVAGLVLGRQAVRGELSMQVAYLIGQRGAEAVENMIKASAFASGVGVLASVWGVLLLLLAAAGVVGELRRTLNLIWEAHEDSTFRGFVLNTGNALALVLGAGFLLLLSLIVSAALTVIGRFFPFLFAGIPYAIEIWNLATFLLFATLLFALIMSGIPFVTIRFREVLPGAFITALLFALGKSALGYYLGRASFASTYGAAGSLAIFLVWVYYAAQIFYLGATITKLWVRGLPKAFQPEVDVEA